MNTTLTKSAAEKSGFCKLDLSNTPLTEDDIDSMEKQLSCSWEITFAGGRTKLYTPTPPPAG
jgi:hypothetical protein